MYVCMYVRIYIYIGMYLCIYVCMYLLPFPREGTSRHTQTSSNTSPEMNHIMLNNNDNNM